MNRTVFTPCLSRNILGLKCSRYSWPVAIIQLFIRLFNVIIPQHHLFLVHRPYRSHHHIAVYSTSGKFVVDMSVVSHWGATNFIHNCHSTIQIYIQANPAENIGWTLFRYLFNEFTGSKKFMNTYSPFKH